MAAFLAAAKALKNKNAEGETINSGGSEGECPFNLDDIFQADTARFSQLKDVLKFIMDGLERNKNKVGEVEMKMVTKFMQIS